MKGIWLIAFILALASSGNIQAAPERPLIFVPGVLGSKLYHSVDDRFDTNDELLWGDRSSYHKFRRLKLHKDDKIIAHGIINKISILGPFRVKQYANLLSHLEDLGYTRGQDLFIFAYDWRKSNFHTADLLNEYINACSQTGSDCARLADGGFDIVAHSMGGVVTRIFMERHPANANRLKKFITLGVPFRGSHAATDSVINGFAGLAKLFSGDQDVIRTIMLSFDTSFELVPMYDSCCYMGDSWTNPEELDLGTLKTWLRFLPSGESATDWQAHITQGLKRRQDLRNIVSSPPTVPTKIYRVASSNIRTKAQMLYNPNSGKVDWQYSPGDGTVPLGSASNLKVDEARVSMKKHSHIFDDKYVEESLRRILILDGIEVPFAIEYTSCKSNPSAQCYFVGTVLTKTSNVTVDPGITIVNDAAEVSFIIEPDPISPDYVIPDELDISPHLCISDAENDESTCLITRRMSRVLPSSPGTIEFHAPAYLSTPGDYRASVHVGSNEILAEYFSVLEIEE